MKSILAAALVLGAGAALAQPVTEPPVAVRLDNLPAHVRERVQAHADQGITSLARYLELTRTVHQLRLMDVLGGYDRSAFFVDDTTLTERQLVEGIREGKIRPAR